MSDGKEPKNKKELPEMPEDLKKMMPDEAIQFIDGKWVYVLDDSSLDELIYTDKTRERVGKLNIRVHYGKTQNK